FNLLKNSAIFIATGVAFYASRLVSQALFFKAFSHIDRLAAVPALPCRWRRIIGSSRAVAIGILRKITLQHSFAQQTIKTPYLLQ
ncbi:hypothetical protein, partial [Aeromonas diversa]|uniref:hypothetical protein n=1 Tax=Aeromonas diversa TaxID=502790 RepID=UPI001E3874C4